MQFSINQRFREKPQIGFASGAHDGDDASSARARVKARRGGRCQLVKEDEIHPRRRRACRRARRSAAADAEGRTDAASALRILEREQERCYGNFLLGNISNNGTTDRRGVMQYVAQSAWAIIRKTSIFGSCDFREHSLLRLMPGFGM